MFFSRNVSYLGSPYSTWQFRKGEIQPSWKIESHLLSFVLKIVLFKTTSLRLYFWRWAIFFTAGSQIYIYIEGSDVFLWTPISRSFRLRPTAFFQVYRCYRHFRINENIYIIWLKKKMASEVISRKQRPINYLYW